MLWCRAPSGWMCTTTAHLKELLYLVNCFLPILEPYCPFPKNEIKFPCCLRDKQLGNASWSSPKLLDSVPLHAVLTQRTNSTELKVTNKTPSLPWGVCSVCYLTKKGFYWPSLKKSFHCCFQFKGKNHWSLWRPWCEAFASGIQWIIVVP